MFTVYNLTFESFYNVWLIPKALVQMAEVYRKMGFIIKGLIRIYKFLIINLFISKR